MKKILFSLICLCVMQTTYAASRNDFAYGYSLEVDGDGAIYSLTLPAEIYQGMVRADHGDIRVFNSQGDAVPHLLQREEKTNSSTPEAKAVPFFPLYSDINTTNVTSGSGNVRITTNEQGAVIDINYGRKDLKQQRVSGYLLDLSAIDAIPNSLQFQWPDNMADFVLTVHVEGSDDLNHWHTLVNGSTLSRLNYGSHQLVQDHIDLPLQKLKYLRLGWSSATIIQFDKILIQFPNVVTSQPRSWQEITATPTQSKDNTDKIFLFDAAGYFPVDRLAVQFSQHNSVVDGVIESSDKLEGPWRTHYRGLLYDLTHNGTTLTTPPVTVAMTTQRYWRIRLAKNESTVNTLTLRLGWIPEQLLFAAQGEAPFVLAYGSARVESNMSALAQVLHQDGVTKETQLIKPARLGTKVTLGDKSRLEAGTPPISWKKWILWSVLVIGVLLLATMAYRLIQQLNQSNKSSGN